MVNAYFLLYLSFPGLLLVCLGGFQLNESCPAQSFFPLKGNFSLPLLAIGGQALGFCKVHRNNCICNRRYINKDELHDIFFTI